MESRCARLLAICRGVAPVGPVQPRASIAAVISLGEIPGEPSTAALFEAIRIDYPSGLELKGHDALGRRCTGEVMRKALELFLSGDAEERKDGAYILMEIRARGHLEELRSHAPEITTDEAKDRLKAVYSLIHLKD